MSKLDVMAFHARWFHPANLNISVAGSVDEREVADSIARATANWNSGDLAPDDAEEFIPGTREDRILSCASPFRMQAAVAVGAVGPPRKSPDYATCAVANVALAGYGGTGSLGRALRDRGTAYKCSANIGGGMGRPPWTIRCDAPPGLADDALRTILEVLDKAAEEPMHERFVEIAANSRRLQTMRKQSSTPGLAAAGLERLLYDDDRDTAAEHTPEAIRGAIAKYFARELRVAVCVEPLV